MSNIKRGSNNMKKVNSQLVEIKGQMVVTDSLTVAEKFEKQHKDVLRKIRNLIKDDEFNQLIFTPVIYVDSKKETQEMYEMNRKTFSILCMSFTGQKALQWKIDFYDAFEKMEKALIKLMVQQQNSEWLAQRAAGKITRKAETDAIKDFVEYATNQGSTNANRYYCNISQMENKALFLLEQKFKNLRDILDLNQLATVTTADAIVSKALKEGMTSRLNYKDIYQLAKSRVETLAELRGKTLIPATQQIEYQRTAIAN